MLLAIERKVQADGEGEQRQDGRTAQCGDVAGGIQHGRWAEGLKIAGPAQREQQSAIEFAGAALHHFVCQRGEEPDAGGQTPDCQKRPELMAAEPSQRAK